MTAIKQTSVKSTGHLKRLEGYLDWERDKALAHDSLNLCSDDCKGMFREMDSTREAYGHNRPGKAGASCTYAQHQILAYQPEMCDMNGGAMTPERCMAFARDYIRERYPNQESLWVLHRERCAADGTDRYAVHILINRTDLGTGRRLDEGRARDAAKARVATVRELDRRYGLRQLKRGRNSETHARQPSKRERKWRDGRGERTENDRVRALIAKHAQEVARIPECPNRHRELARRLELDGVTMTRSKGGDLQFRFRSESLERSGGGSVRKVNGATLGEARSRKTGQALGLDLHGVSKALGMAGRAMRLSDRVFDDGRER